MRPDVEAFRELDALVRKLTEQLTSYRRRALEAEARSRDLELELGVMASSVEASRAAVTATVADVSASEVALENERLRARLSEARERTALVADRVRFLRQQLTSGAER